MTYTTPDERIPMAVLVAKQLVQTAPHVAYGTEEMNFLISLAHQDVLDSLPEDVLRDRKPAAPHFTTVLPAIEALGKLVVTRDVEVRNQGAAYTETDRFSVLCPEPETEDPSSVLDLPIPDGLSTEEVVALADSFESEVSDLSTLRQVIIAKTSYSLGYEDGTRDTETRNGTGVEALHQHFLETQDELPSVTQPDVTESYRQGYRDGFTDARAL